MPHVFIVLGDANTRKSSTVRALTGIAKRGVYQVAIAHGDDIQVFVQVVACQEEPISPEDFVNRVTRKNCTNVLVSLRITGCNGQPGGDVYIERFLHEGWNAREIVILGVDQLPYELPQNLPEPNSIPRSQNAAANRIASQIRGWWRWL